MKLVRSTVDMIAVFRNEEGGGDGCEGDEADS